MGSLFSNENLAFLVFSLLLSEVSLFFLKTSFFFLAKKARIGGSGQIKFQIKFHKHTFADLAALMISRVKSAKFSAKSVANFRRSLEGDFRASFAGENRQKHFPPKLQRKLHHQTSLRGSGLWQARPSWDSREPLKGGKNTPTPYLRQN